VKEDALGYLKRCYVPMQYIEDMLSLVGQPDRSREEDIPRVKNQVYALLERNIVQSEIAGLSDLFGVEALRRMSKSSSRQSRT
jgi:hypothetical protein